MSSTTAVCVLLWQDLIGTCAADILHTKDAQAVHSSMDVMELKQLGCIEAFNSLDSFGRQALCI